MKVGVDKIEIDQKTVIFWKDVKTLRILNDKLVFVFLNGKTLEFSNILPQTMDSAFRAYEKYLADHPENIVD